MTVIVSVWVAFGSTPLLAVTVQVMVPLAVALPLMVAVLPAT